MNPCPSRFFVFPKSIQKVCFLYIQTPLQIGLWESAAKVIWDTWERPSVITPVTSAISSLITYNWGKTWLESVSTKSPYEPFPGWPDCQKQKQNNTKQHITWTKQTKNFNSQILAKKHQCKFSSQFDDWDKTSKLLTLPFSTCSYSAPWISCSGFLFSKALLSYLDIPP